MVHLKALLQAAQNGDGVLHRGLFHHYGLEAPLQGGVLFNILAVLVHRGGADAVQFAARQHGLEQIARVHGALGLARAHNSMQFVDEEDDLAFAFLHFIEHGLEPFLELAPVFGPGDKRAHVQGEEFAALEALGHVALDDAEGQAFHDGGFAHARFADEHRIVLGAPRKNADHPADFRVAADDRVHLALARRVHQVARIFAQGLEGVLGIGAGHARAAAQLFHGLDEARAGDVVFLEHLAQGRGRLHFGQRGKKMIHADVFVLHPPGLVLGFAQNLGQTRGDHDLGGVHAAAGNRGPLAQRGFQGHGQSLGLDAHMFQNTGDNALFLLHQGQRQMFGVRLLMAHARRDGLCLADGLPGFFRKLVDIHNSSTQCRGCRALGVYFHPAGPVA